MADDKPDAKEPITGKSIRLTPEEIEALRKENLRDCARLDILIQQRKATGAEPE